MREASLSNSHAPNPVDSELMSRFDRSAGNYDKERCQTPAGEFFCELEELIITEWVLRTDGCKGLDMPCGTGRLTTSLANSCEEVIACDISFEMLAIAREKTRGRGITNATFHQANGRRLPFPDKTFDTIICFNFLHLIPNDQKAEFIAEFARALKAGGRLIIEFNSPFYGLFLALLRYRRRLREIPRRCFFPGQGRWLFRGFRKADVVGIGFPLLWLLGRIFDKNMVMRASLTLGKIPIIQFLAYALVFELHNESEK